MISGQNVDFASAKMLISERGIEQENLRHPIAVAESIFNWQ